VRKVEIRRSSASFPPIRISVGDIVTVFLEHSNGRDTLTLTSGNTIFEGADEINAHAAIIGLPLEVEMGRVYVTLQRGGGKNTLYGDAESSVKVQALARKLSEHKNWLSFWSTPFGFGILIILILGVNFLPSALSKAQPEIASSIVVWFGLPVLTLGFWIAFLAYLQDKYCGNMIRYSSRKGFVARNWGAIVLLVLGAFLTAAFEWFFGVL